ncbi:MAG: cation:dicarboxylase symporter family transporter [Spirochaetia bacterium]|nr:cation:dicarboxylase symporter family transporter [Spirochaetia bacterium]
MKIWIKYLLGAVAGAILGFIFRPFFSDPDNFIIFRRIILNIGRYTFTPLIFFSVCVGISRLLYAKLLAKIFLKTGIFAVMTSALLTVIGGISVMLIPGGRIPIISINTCDASDFTVPGLAQHLTMIFPDSFLSIFTSSGYLLPVLLLAFLIGINIHHNQMASSRPVIQLFDSLDRIFFEINNLIIEFLPIGILLLSAFFTATAITDRRITLYSNMLTIIAADCLLAALVIFPAAIYFCTRSNANPFKYLYAITSASIAAFFSGDIYFGAANLIKCAFENCGIKRKISSPIIGLMSVFGRAGTAMAAAVTFMTIIRSFSGIEITVPVFMSVMLHSFIFSMALGTVPGYGVMAELVMLCGWYGHGLQDGYMIMEPALFILLGLGALTDTIIMAAVTTVIAIQESQATEKPINKFT